MRMPLDPILEKHAKVEKLQQDNFNHAKILSGEKWEVITENIVYP